MGQKISTAVIAVASPTPISCRSGLDPKLPPLFTVLKISREPDGVATVTLMRAPMAARLDFVPSSFSFNQRLVLPGLRNSALR